MESILQAVFSTLGSKTGDMAALAASNVIDLPFLFKSSQLKQHDYIVSLVPPQSYFDFQTSQFSTYIYFPPGDPWHQNFTYAGRNVYAYWLAKYGTTNVDQPGHDKKSKSVPTFDFVDVQFYEGYSRSGYALDVQNMTFADYFVNVYLQNISQNSWEVNFSENSSLPDQIINLSIAEKLVVGFAVTKLNKKVTYISPEQIAEAWNVLESSGMATPRGLMFWNMKLEPDDTNDPSNMANAFNEILHTRENSEKFRPNCV
ncbi:uncharacterized protein LOC142352855 [Convolutriloba macropyga]|uniref:uncharacterized protein LOC142352855 n=1 Tax=Convolutriloba macropyga TaxID=536237 RepID=UPI003F521CCE